MKLTGAELGAPSSMGARGIIYRKPVEDDIQELARLHVLCWQQAYATLLPVEFLRDLSVEKRAENWRVTISDPEVFALIACHDERIVGFQSAGPVRSQGERYGDGEVYAIYVHADFYRCGTGHALLSAARRYWIGTHGKSLVVFYMAENHRAGKFYLSQGGALVHQGMSVVGGISVAEKAVVFKDCDQFPT